MDRNQQMQVIADQYVNAQKYSGIQWCVEAGGECLSSGQSGFTDAAARTPIPEHALYRIYSMTKPIVSVLALMLMERGKLR